MHAYNYSQKGLCRKRVTYNKKGQNYHEIQKSVVSTGISVGKRDTYSQKGITTMIYKNLYFPQDFLWKIRDHTNLYSRELIKHLFCLNLILYLSTVVICIHL